MDIGRERQPWWGYLLVPMVYSGKVRFRRWHLLMLPVSFPVFCVGFSLILVGAYVFAVLGRPFAVRRAKREQQAEKDFYVQMRGRGRVRNWREMEALFAAGVGTAIVEQGMELHDRLWWTEEDVLRACPCRPPSEEELDCFGYYRPHPFVEWCFGRYIEAEGGTAVLIEGVELPAKPPTFEYWDSGGTGVYLRYRYPSLSVVNTVYYRFPRCLKCGYDLRESRVICPECGAEAPKPKWEKISEAKDS